MSLVICRLAEFPPGSRKIVKAGSRSIGIFRIGDKFFALRNRCPHQGGPLCLGRLFPWTHGDVPGNVAVGESPALIACPWHGWEYDLETGQSFIGPGETRVKRYDVTVSARGPVGAEDDWAECEPIPPTARSAERTPGPYVAETFTVYIKDEYVVLDA